MSNSLLGISLLLHALRIGADPGFNNKEEKMRGGWVDQGGWWGGGGGGGSG